MNDTRVPVGDGPPIELSLPVGFRLRADRSLERTDLGRLVVGGAPMRILRLTSRGAERLDSWLGGEPLGPSASDHRLVRRLLDAGLVHPWRPVDSAPPTVTFVVPVRDDAAGLERLLTDMAALVTSAPIVVVDDGSSDRRAHEGPALAAGATYVRLDASVGPGAARNRGLEEVRTDVVVFVDADVATGELDLGRLTGHFADPAVVAVAPRVRSPATEPGLVAAYETVHSPLDLGPDPSPVGPGRRVTYVPAACLVVRTPVLRDLGGFDRELRWGEDVDLVWRMVEAGDTVRYEPAVEVEHRPRSDLRGLIDQRRRYGSSAAPLAARHGPSVAPIRCSLSSAGVWLAALRGDPVLATAIAAESASVLARRLAHLPGGAPLGARLVLMGHGRAARALSRETGRSWWPLTAAAALVAGRRRSPSLVVGVLTGVVLHHLLDWLRHPGPIGPLPTVGLRIVDDLAYGVGVWEGMWAQRSLAAIRPHFTSR